MSSFASVPGALVLLKCSASPNSSNFDLLPLAIVRGLAVAAHLAPADKEGHKLDQPRGNKTIARRLRRDPLLQGVPDDPKLARDRLAAPLYPTLARGCSYRRLLAECLATFSYPSSLRNARTLFATSSLPAPFDGAKLAMTILDSRSLATSAVFGLASAAVPRK